MSLPDLAAILWRQRELLERLMYRLECEQLLIASGRTRWLATATSEVEVLLEELQLMELQRAAVADRAAAELGLPIGSSLEDLAAAASPPWTGVLVDHRNALVTLTAELGTISESNRQMTAAGLAAVEATLSTIGMRVGSTSQGYDSRGRTETIAGQGRAMVDWAL